MPRLRLIPSALLNKLKSPEHLDGRYVVKENTDYAKGVSQREKEIKREVRVEGSSASMLSKHSHI